MYKNLENIYSYACNYSYTAVAYSVKFSSLCLSFLKLHHLQIIQGTVMLRVEL